jgi:hypothetical protein
MGCTGCFTQRVILELFHLQKGEVAMSTKKAKIDALMSIGVDIGKDVFHLVGFDPSGERVLRKKIKRHQLEQVFEDFPRCIVGMEACLSAHFVNRSLRKMGFEPRIIPAIYVKPFNKGQKNDYNDAEAIAEAALRRNLKTVPEKTQDQHDLQALHRVRSRLVSRGTAMVNQIRAFLIEQGITVRRGSDLCPVNTVLAGERYWGASQSEAIGICACSLCKSCTSYYDAAPELAQV